MMVFSKMPLVMIQPFTNKEERDHLIREWRRDRPGHVVRSFTRTVRAGGASTHVFVAVVRKAVAL